MESCTNDRTIAVEPTISEPTPCWYSTLHDLAAIKLPDVVGFRPTIRINHSDNTSEVKWDSSVLVEACSSNSKQSQPYMVSLGLVTMNRPQSMQQVTKSHQQQHTSSLSSNAWL